MRLTLFGYLPWLGNWLTVLAVLLLQSSLLGTYVLGEVETFEFVLQGILWMVLCAAAAAAVLLIGGQGIVVDVGQ